MARQEGKAVHARETVRAIKCRLLNHARGVKYLVNPLYPRETLPAGGNRENIILLARFHEQRTRRDQSRDIVHLRVIQNSGDVIVDAVRKAQDAIAKDVQVAAD